MTDIERHLTGIIGEVLFHTEYEPDDIENIDWDALLEESIKQTVFPIIFSYAEKRMERNSSYEKYKVKTLSYLRRYLKNLHYHNILHRLLDENDISYVILKGPVSASYYPNPVVRIMGDVDFLVDIKDRNRAQELLLKSGYSKDEEGSLR